MNILEAFKQLDRLNESATDDFRQIVKEMDTLESEIEELQKQKSNGWTDEFAKTVDTEEKALKQLEIDLDTLRRTYKHKVYTEWDRDGDPTDFEYRIDDNKKAAVAEQEAELVNKLKELKDRFKKLKTDAEAAHTAKFADHIKAINDKSNLLSSKKDLKNTTLKKVIEEDRQELEGIIAKINAEVPMTPLWDDVSFSGNKIFLTLETEELESYEISYDEINFDDDYPSINVDSLYERLEENATFDYMNYIGLYGLGIDIKPYKKGDLIPIPGSSWKLLYDCDIFPEDEPQVTHYKYTPATYWDTASEDLEYDETVYYSVNCYLVKEI
jgi:DNA repair exonuclease SbcCD ATPase subunit